MNTIDQFMELVQKHAEVGTKTKFYQHRIEHHPLNLLWENRESLRMSGYNKQFLILTLLIIRFQTVLYSRFPKKMKQTRLNQKFIHKMDALLIPIISQFDLRPCDPAYIFQPIRSNDLNVTLRMRKYASLYSPQLLEEKEKHASNLFRERLIDEVINIEKDIQIEEKALRQSIKSGMSMLISIMVFSICVNWINHLFQQNGIYEVRHFVDLMPLVKLDTYKQSLLSFEMTSITAFLPKNVEWLIIGGLIALRSVLSEKLYGIFPAAIMAYIIIYGSSQAVAWALLRWGALCMQVELFTIVLLYLAGKCQISARRHALNFWHEIYESIDGEEECYRAFEKLRRSALKLTIRQTRLLYMPILVVILAGLYVIVPYIARVFIAVTGG